MTSETLNLRTDSLDQLVSKRENCFRHIREKKSPDMVIKAREMLKAIKEELNHRYLPGAIERFFEEFPEGFYDQKYLEQERNIKLETSQLCHQILGQERFRQHISDKTWSTITVAIKKLVYRTNMLQANFEKSQLITAFADADKQSILIPALYDCLHGEGSPSARLGRFSDVIQDFNLGKWTFATYFLFLNDPQNCIFINPERIRRAMQISQYPALFDSTPNAAQYGHFLGFADFLKIQLAEHKPRDMIDIQSFIWIMAQTGIHSRV